MRIEVVNHQRRDPVPLERLRLLAGCVLHRLRVKEEGCVSISFIGSDAMRAANRRFLRHRGLTDVLSFRYGQASSHKPQATSRCLQHAACSVQPIVGEILVAPACARLYAKQHGLPYREELARYMVHGLLHWVGYDDRTVKEQQRMRQMENRLLAECAGE
ncbi:MAG: rRNA maturation RNase YbeY [Candidatus Omnitrophica bacterium]|nr:rRNA maturation RNase YbeY [Candidatus Omnitrophota bacterium]